MCLFLRFCARSDNPVLNHQGVRQDGMRHGKICRKLCGRDGKAGPGPGSEEGRPGQVGSGRKPRERRPGERRPGERRSRKRRSRKRRSRKRRSRKRRTRERQGCFSPDLRALSLSEFPRTYFLKFCALRKVFFAFIHYHNGRSIDMSGGCRLVTEES